MSEQLSEYEFELTVLDTETLVKESTYHDFDFFLLDPVSFLTLRGIGVVGGTLGTLSRGDGSLSANLMGGVIIQRKEKPIIALQDIHKYDIAVSSPHYLENYIAQAFELETLGYLKPALDKLSSSDTRMPSILQASITADTLARSSMALVSKISSSSRVTISFGNSPNSARNSGIKEACCN